jgi:hypothetical protein
MERARDAERWREESSTGVATVGAARGGRLGRAKAAIGEDSDGAEARGEGDAHGCCSGERKERRSRHPRFKSVNFQWPRYDHRK